MVLTISIDKSGRLVIPKSIRDRLGLAEGAEFEISELRDGLILKVLPQGSALEEVDGLWVHPGRPDPESDLFLAIRNQREDRIRELTRSQIP